MRSVPSTDFLEVGTTRHFFDVTPTATSGAPLFLILFPGPQVALHPSISDFDIRNQKERMFLSSWRPSHLTILFFAFLAILPFSAYSATLPLSEATALYDLCRGFFPDGDSADNGWSCPDAPTLQTTGCNFPYVGCNFMDGGDHIVSLYS